MATLTVQKTTLGGIVPTYAAAAAGGDEFANDGETYFHVKNASAGSVTVTLDSVRACDQGFDHNSGGAVAAGAEAVYGPFAKARFNNVSGRVAATYTAVTSVTVAAVSVLGS